ncbi:predicted protein [Plenodomus lingam JN3]|uniref:Predicted protein n=1 Tax=Leptosphaeria maculans (strain JN3 / isolate v23.1.3 / race Av1-4-5-6-7-8) TaxID=985895 RepID=E5A875_LEPMJ|nr:predicted protein [Plenodomus lingam JN3]CBX99820.1 predicted protein [Plenodomus lingam JN3]
MKALTDEKNESQRVPVVLVHCDYTDESDPLHTGRTASFSLLAIRECTIMQ